MTVSKEGEKTRPLAPVCFLSPETVSVVVFVGGKRAPPPLTCHKDISASNWEKERARPGLIGEDAVLPDVLRGPHCGDLIPAGGDPQGWRGVIIGMKGTVDERLPVLICKRADPPCGSCWLRRSRWEERRREGSRRRTLSPDLRPRPLPTELGRKMITSTWGIGGDAGPLP